MMRHQAFDLEIVGAADFPELVGTIFRLLPIVSDLDIVTLSLIDTGADIYTVMHKLGVDFEPSPNLMFYESAEELGYDPSPARCPSRASGCTTRSRSAWPSRRHLADWPASRWCRWCATSA